MTVRDAYLAAVLDRRRLQKAVHAAREEESNLSLELTAAYEAEHSAASAVLNEITGGLK